MFIKIVFSVFALFAAVESANILAVYPVPSVSHQVVFRKITLELVKQGHDVTVITPNPAYPKKDGPHKLTEIDIHDISYGMMHKNLMAMAKKGMDMDIESILRMMNEMNDIQLQLPEVQEIVLNSTKQFDLILIEELGRPFMGISHILNAPVILFSSFGGLPITFDLFGMPTHPLLYPSAFDRRVYNLSLKEKIYKIYKYYSLFYENRIILEEEHKLLKKHFGPEIPSIYELYNNVHMMFVNVHSIWVENQPVPPSVLFLGGLHQLATKELPQDLKNYLDSSKHGVIYVSFGTNALSNVLQTNKIETIAKVLGQMPYDVLWKWDQDTLPGQTNNIKLSKWLPQADLLKHPKIKLFITQAGLQSTDEAITAGVPLVAFPVLGDQWYNAEKYERFGIGMKYLFEEINEDVVRHAVQTVISDESYRLNIIKLRDLINDQPISPIERTIFWINHVIRHKGGKHLLPLGANLTWTQYYEVDLILIVISTALVALILFIILVYYIYQFVRRNIIISKKIKAT